MVCRNLVLVILWNISLGVAIIKFYTIESLRFTFQRKISITLDRNYEYIFTWMEFIATCLLNSLYILCIWLEQPCLGGMDMFLATWIIWTNIIYMAMGD